MKIFNSARIKASVIAAAAVVLMAVGGCMDAGDGVGLDKNGQPIADVVDPCIANPTDPACRIDSCRTAPPAPGCSVNVCRDNPEDPSCKPGLAKMSFKQEVLPIIKEHCQECHLPGGTGLGYITGKLNLSNDSAYASLVNAKATQAKAWLRVKPGSADSSVLYVKIAMTQPKLPSGMAYGAAMPIGKSLLSEPNLDIIRKWITDGAEK